MAETLGVPGYPYAVVSHPIGRLEPERLSERIEQAIGDVSKLLTEPLTLAHPDSA